MTRPRQTQRRGSWGLKHRQGQGSAEPEAQSRPAGREGPAQSQGFTSPCRADQPGDSGSHTLPAPQFPQLQNRVEATGHRKDKQGILAVAVALFLPPGICQARELRILLVLLKCHLLIEALPDHLTSTRTLCTIPFPPALHSASSQHSALPDIIIPVGVLVFCHPHRRVEHMSILATTILGTWPRASHSRST